MKYTQDRCLTFSPLAQGIALLTALGVQGNWRWFGFLKPILPGAFLCSLGGSRGLRTGICYGKHIQVKHFACVIIRQLPKPQQLSHQEMTKVSPAPETRAGNQSGDWEVTWFGVQPRPGTKPGSRMLLPNAPSGSGSLVQICWMLRGHPSIPVLLDQSRAQ